jgi:hypothetical protein
VSLFVTAIQCNKSSETVRRHVDRRMRCRDDVQYLFTAKRFRAIYLLRSRYFCDAISRLFGGSHSAKGQPAPSASHDRRSAWGRPRSSGIHRFGCPPHRTSSYHLHAACPRCFSGRGDGEDRVRFSLTDPGPRPSDGTTRVNPVHVMMPAGSSRFVSS